MKNFEILLVKGRSFLNIFDWLIPRESSYYGIDRFPVASKYRCPQDVSFKLFLVVLVVVLSVLRITVSGYPIQKFNLFLVIYSVLMLKQ